MPLIEQREMEIFALLLHDGIPFLDAVTMSFTRKEQILHLLESGVAFDRIIMGQKGRRMRQMGVLMQNFPLSDALEFDERLDASRKSIYGTLVQKGSYPLFIMAFATALICFFSYSIVPALMSESAQSIPLLAFLQTASLLFWIVISFLAITVTWMILLPRQASRYSGVLFRMPILRYLCSMECASLFECTQTAGLSTKQLWTLIHDSKCFPFCEILWRRWMKEMKSGFSLYQCIQKDERLDPLFIRFFEIGAKGSRMQDMMKTYQKSSALIFEKKLKTFTTILLYISYAFVGVLALSVYQIMLEPLTMLESM